MKDIEKIIVSVVLALLIFLVETILWLLNLLFDVSVELSDSASDAEPERPADIPPEIWQLRSVLQAPASREAAVENLIASGVDSSALLTLVEFMQSPDYGQNLPLRRTESQLNVIGICGKYFRLPFSRESLQSAISINHDWIYAICAGVLVGLATYLALSVLHDRDEEFVPIERQGSAKDWWWFAIVLTGVAATSVWRPDREPFMAVVDDPWVGLARALAVICVAGLWRVAAALERGGSVLEFVGFRVDVAPFLPYVYTMCYWGLVLLPFWLMLGVVGHPVPVFFALIEAFNRYAFGQSGIVGFRHMVIQVLRGVLGAGISWLLITYCDYKIALPASMAVATFVGMVPVWVTKECLSHWVISFGWPIVCTATAFVIPFAISGASDRVANVIAIFATSWCGFSDILLPLVCSFNKVGPLHFRLYRGPVGGLGIVRCLTPFAVGPLTIAVALRAPAVAPALVLSLAIVHAVQKVHTEPHVFALAQLLAVSTLPQEFGVAEAAPAFALSLLIAAKWESVLPFLHLFSRARECVFELQELDNIFFHFLAVILLRHPFCDWSFRIPSLVWSLLTGATLYAIDGRPRYSGPGAIRPFYFAAFPVREASDFHDMLARALANQPLDAPVFTSAALVLARNFAGLVRSCRLGLVTCGDMFLFQSTGLFVLAHVVAIEPGCFRVQVRCQSWNGEISEFQWGDVAEASPIDRATIATVSAANLRQTEVSLRMYDVSQLPLENAFVGVTPVDSFEWFALAFCHVVARSGLRANVLQPPPETILPRLQRAMALEGKFAALFTRLGVEMSEEEVRAFTVFWGMVALSLFQETGIVDVRNLPPAFRGVLELPEELAWVYGVNELPGLITRAVRLGIACVHLATAPLAPSRLSGEENWLAEVATWLDDAHNQLLVVPMGSPEFEEALFAGERPLQSLEPAGEERTSPAILRFGLTEKEWTVFRLDHESIRSIWANELRQVLFFEGSNRDRGSLEQNSVWFTPLIVELYDNPVGKPGLVSPFFASLVNPFVC